MKETKGEGSYRSQSRLNFRAKLKLSSGLPYHEARLYLGQVQWESFHEPEALDCEPSPAEPNGLLPTEEHPTIIFG